MEILFYFLFYLGLFYIALSLIGLVMQALGECVRGVELNAIAGAVMILAACCIHELCQLGVGFTFW